LNENLRAIGISEDAGIIVSASGVSSIRSIRLRPEKFALNNETVFEIKVRLPPINFTRGDTGTNSFKS